MPGKIKAIFRPRHIDEKGGYTKLYLQANCDFHFEVYRLAQSQVMMSIIETLWLQISPYFHMLTASENFRASQRHHEAILTDIEQRRPQEAHRAMQPDIADAFELLKRFF